MLGTIMKSAIAGAAALLLVQGSAIGATITNTDIDEDLGAIGANESVLFDASPTGHPDSSDFTDYYLIEFTEPVDTVTVAAGSEVNPIDPTKFTLELFALSDTDDLSVGVDTLLLTSQGIGDGTGMVASLLAAGRYILQVAYFDSEGSSGDGYSGKITATPLPPAMMIFLTGLFGMGWLARYRRRRGQFGLRA